MIEHENQIPEEGRNDAPLEVVGSRDVAPGTSQTPEDREQQYYRELVKSFYATLTRWQALLNEDRFQLSGEYQQAKNMQAFDVITTAEGNALVPVPQGDIVVYRNRNDQLDEPHDRIMSLLGVTTVFRPDLKRFEREYRIEPGLAGEQILADINGDQLRRVVVTVSGDTSRIGPLPLDYLHMQGLEIVAIQGVADFWSPEPEHQQHVVYYDLHEPTGKKMVAIRGGGGIKPMSDESATHLFTTIDALIPGTPAATQQLGRRRMPEIARPQQLPSPRRRPGQ
jgi:hypothetical protein